MMAKQTALLAFALCCGLGAYTVALPTRQAGNPGIVVDDEPDLLHMLDYFKGKSDMTLLVTFLKQAELLKTTAKGIYDVCAVCRQVLTDAGENNVGMRILGKVVEGGMPDIKDMYDLATKGNGNMKTAFFQARKKNKKYSEFTNLMVSNSSFVLHSASELQNTLNFLFGNHFKIDPELLKEVNDGSVKVNANNLPQVNLLEFESFTLKNSIIFHSFYTALLTPPLNFENLLSMFKGLDTSNLAMIKSINGGMTNDKYTVAGAKQTLVTDPLAEKVMEEFNHILNTQRGKSAHGLSAESLIMNAVVDALKLMTQVLKGAENNRKLSN